MPADISTPTFRRAGDAAGREERLRIIQAEQVHWWYQHNRALAARLMVDFVRPGIRSLDAGCTSGANGGWLSAFGSLTAVSADRAGLHAYGDATQAADLVEATPWALPFAEGVFDVILAISTIHDTAGAGPRAVCEEYSRVLAPGGGLYMIEPVRSPRGAAPGDSVTLPLLAGGAEAAGFEILRESRANVSPWIEGVFEPGAYHLGLGDVRESDLTWGSRLVRNILWFIAGLERTYLMSRDLAVGTSALVVARKPRDGGGGG